MLTSADIDTLVDEIKSLRSLVVDLQLKIRELERRPWLKYEGTWDGDRRYPAGSIITWDGSTWIAKVATAAKPGGPETESRDWQLIAKRGAAAKNCPCAATHAETRRA